MLAVRLCLLGATLLLIGIGITTIYSVGHPAEQSPAGQTEDLSVFLKRQIYFTVLGLFVFVIVNLINYRWLGALSYWLLAAVLMLLALLLVSKFVVTLPFAKPINGTYRWIWIPGRAWYLRYRSNYRKFKALIGPFALALLPMVLILPEPDLGTVMLMMPILFIMLFVAGAKVKHLLLITLMALMVSP
ncbi:MAG: FtsW/RodA/SpoVE family cell cycle protein, partial [Planctomycetota bacterium]